ncbi:MAG: NYN domain-containing protein [Alistipes sp.]|nr:NYN domain-containing protein [Alistipes sp.]
MKECVIIVDNSNVWIEGKKYSARKKNIKVGDDPSWRIDFGKLLSTVANGQPIRNAILVGSRPPQNDSVWNAAKQNGFSVIVHDRNCVGKEKSVDTELVAQGTKIVCTSSAGTLKLLSGDRDFIPLINIATELRWETEMWAFSNAFQQTGVMAQSVTRINSLDNVFSKIGHCEFKWPTE